MNLAAFKCFNPKTAVTALHNHVVCLLHQGFRVKSFNFSYFLYFSTLQMLVNIENRLEELFEQIEMMPQDKVEAAEKVGHFISEIRQVKNKLTRFSQMLVYTSLRIRN